MGNPKLTVTARTLIEDESNDKLLSLVSIWEMAIKQSIGKLTLNLPLKDYIEQKLSLKDCPSSSPSLVALYMPLRSL